MAAKQVAEARSEKRSSCCSLIVLSMLPGLAVGRRLLERNALAACNGSSRGTDHLAV